MSERVTISIPDDEEHLLKWVEQKVEDRRFRNTSEAFRIGIKEMKKSEEQDFNV